MKYSRSVTVILNPCPTAKSLTPKVKNRQFIVKYGLIRFFEIFELIPKGKRQNKHRSTKLSHPCSNKQTKLSKNKNTRIKLE